MGEKQRLVLPTRMWHKFLEDVNSVYSVIEYLLHTKVQLGQWWVLLELLKGIWERSYFQKLKWLKDYYIPVWETKIGNLFSFSDFLRLLSCLLPKLMELPLMMDISLLLSIFCFFFHFFSTIVFQHAFLCDEGL